MAARQRPERDVLMARDALEIKSEELKRQRAWFEVTLASIGDGVIGTDIDGKVTFMNSVAEQLTGWVAREAVGKSVEQVFKIVNEITGLPAENPVREVLAAGVSLVLADHSALVSRAGPIVPIEDRAAPIRDAGGQVSGSVMVFHDVTSRRGTERALRASEERFRAAFAQGAVGIAVASVAGRFLELNQRFCDILGRTKEELLDRTFADITHAADLPETLANVARLRAGEIPFYVMEKRYLRKDGTAIWSRTAVSLLQESTSQSLQFIGVIEDISERKATEEALRESAQRLHLALAAGGLGDWSWDKRTGLVSLGVRAAEILFVPQNQPVSWVDIRERILPEDRERTFEAIARSLEDRTVSSLECRIVDPLGQRAWVAARGQGIYDSAGELLGATGVVQKITDRKLADEARGAARWS